MTGWADGPLCGFDLETTGPDPETARIVTAAVISRGTASDGDRSWLVNPGIEIPEEAAKVHGITTEHAREHGRDPFDALAEISAGLEELMILGVPLVIYNAPYDLTVLDRETRRLGLTPFADVFTAQAGLVIDPLVLDKHANPYRRGKRTLTAACEHYRVTIDGAHEAGADAVAAMRVAWKIARNYPVIGATPLGDLHELQVKAKAGQAASFQDYLRRQGNDEVIDGSWPLKPFGGAS